MKRSEFLKLSSVGLVSLLISPYIKSEQSEINTDVLNDDRVRIMLSNGEHIVNKTIVLRNTMILENDGFYVSNCDIRMKRGLFSRNKPTIFISNKVKNGTFTYNYIHS